MDKQNGRLWITDIAGVTGDVFEKIVGKLKREEIWAPSSFGLPQSWA